MSTFEAYEEFIVSILRKEIAITMILALLFWTIGVPTLIRSAHAAQLTSVSDTLSDSNNGDAAKHTIAFTATNAIYSGNTIKISLDPTGTSPGTSAFSEVYSAATSSDFTLNAGVSYAIVGVGGCTSGNQATLVGNYNGGSDENATFTLCPSATTIATSTVVTIVAGAVTPQWYNPSTTGSYAIRIGGTMTNSGDTRVAVLPNVQVTASVDTTFTFTVSGLATSTTFNGITTTGSTTPTALPFNTLVPNASSTLGQALSVTTNARNGFAVTVQENQPLTSSTGAIIYLFDNGATTTSPIPWASPSNILDQANTFGHLGISSDDADEGGGEFNSSKYAGNIITPREVFSHNGPSDGTTQNKGLAHVLYTIQIGTLQPAGNDYTNTLTYVATPTY